MKNIVNKARLLLLVCLALIIFVQARLVALFHEQTRRAQDQTQRAVRQTDDALRLLEAQKMAPGFWVRYTWTNSPYGHFERAEFFNTTGDTNLGKVAEAVFAPHPEWFFKASFTN